MIQISNVTLFHQGKQLLSDVSATFEAGKIHGIVGQNGSGKTLLLKSVCGYLCPSSGKILIGGKQLYSEIQFPPSIGMILESPGFLHYATGYQNLLWLARIRNKIGREEILYALEQVGLENEARKLVGQYSLGMRQRLGIAQAIMERPSLLVLDEPFNGLDEACVNRIYDLFNTLRKDGTTFLLTSHHQEDIATLCDTVSHMKAGKLTLS